MHQMDVEQPRMLSAGYQAAMLPGSIAHQHECMYGCCSSHLWVQMLATWAHASRQSHPHWLSWLLPLSWAHAPHLGPSTAKCRWWTGRAASSARTSSPVDYAAGLQLLQIALQLGQQRNKRRPRGTSRPPQCPGCRFRSGSEQGRSFTSSLCSELDVSGDVRVQLTC